MPKLERPISLTYDHETGDHRFVALTDQELIEHVSGQTIAEARIPARLTEGETEDDAMKRIVKEHDRHRQTVRARLRDWESFESASKRCAVICECECGAVFYISEAEAMKHITANVAARCQLHDPA